MRISPLSLVIIIVFSLTVYAQDGKNDAAIKLVLQKFVTAQTEYDAKMLDSLFTPDYIEISPLGEFDPRDKVLGFYKPELKPNPTKMSAVVDVTEYSIRSYDNFAVAIARLNYTMTSEGKPMPPRSIRVTVVLKKEKGDWKIASTQYTGIRPPAAPPKTN